MKLTCIWLLVDARFECKECLKKFQLNQRKNNSRKSFHAFFNWNDFAVKPREIDIWNLTLVWNLTNVNLLRKNVRKSNLTTLVWTDGTNWKPFVGDVCLKGLIQNSDLNKRERIRKETKTNSHKREAICLRYLLEEIQSKWQISKI